MHGNVSENESEKEVTKNIRTLSRAESAQAGGGTFDAVLSLQESGKDASVSRMGDYVKLDGGSTLIISVCC